MYINVIIYIVLNVIYYSTIPKTKKYKHQRDRKSVF